MTTSVNASVQPQPLAVSGAGPDTTTIPPAPPPAAPAPAPPPKPTASTSDSSSRIQADDVRLIIDYDKKTDSFVYRLYDPATGRLVREIPQQTLGQLTEDPSYEAGAVIDTSA